MSVYVRAYASELTAYILAVYGGVKPCRSEQKKCTEIECNTVTGDGLTLGAINTYGIVAAGGVLGGVSTYQCNNVTNTYRGVFFEGFNNNVVFRGNGFDRHDVGLLMDGGSIIGDQFDNQGYYGNTWTGGANSDVFHDG
ncbi:MAG: hypothetical protein JKY03_02560, partial [Aureispira sp.]|nr:hypothetical protein [Aureispira sp.]